MDTHWYRGCIVGQVGGFVDVRGEVLDLSVLVFCLGY